MNFDWAPFTDKVIDNGFGGTRAGATIKGIVIHHGAGTDVLGYVANANSRSSHPTYHIASSGALTGIVHPSRRPFSTGHNIDRESITVEIDNSSVGGDWPISDKAQATLAKLIAHHESTSPRTGVALNKPSETQSEFFVAWHQQYSATACPGPYILKRLGNIVDAARGLLGEVAPPTPTPPAPPKPAGRPVIRKGSKGAAVTEAQKRLIAHGFSVGSWGADGDFGDATDSATRRFQSARKLTVDGIIGPQTWTELLKAASRTTSPQATSRPTLRQGAKGQSVSLLQGHLNKHYPLYSKLVVDGEYGPKSVSVVREFQRRAGITVDGIVGPQTWAALGL